MICLDSNKFGQKLLEKMGWSQGKGLGLKENGMTEHVKLTYKNDSCGMGYKEQTEQWTEHEDNFSSLLESLSDAVENESSKQNENKQISSLEQKSQNIKSRVHYHKFTRSKDLSRYSEKDLACIFGNKMTKTENTSDSVTAEDDNDKSTEDQRFGVQTYNAGSMLDYFKKKLPNFQPTGYAIGNNGVLTNNGLKENDEETDQQIVNFSLSNETDEDGKKKKKTSKKRKLEENECDSSTKQKKTKKQVDSDLGVVNPGFDPLFNKITMEKHVLNTIAENDLEESINENIQENSINLDEKESKKKRKSLEMIDTSNDDNVTGKKEKKSKRKNNACGLDNTGFSDLTQIENSTATLEEENSAKKEKKKKKNKAEKEQNLEKFVESEELSEPSTKKEKKKKNKVKNNESEGLENPSFQSFDQNEMQQDDKTEKKQGENDVNENTLDTSGKSKKKKRKSSQIDTGLDNPAFHEKLEKLEINSNNSLENKSKSGLDNPNFIDETNECTSENKSQVAENYEVKRKEKKSKKKEKQENGIDNPGLNALDSSCANTSMSESLGQNFEVNRKRKKSKKDKQDGGIDNPTLNTSDPSCEQYEISSINADNSTSENPYEIKVKKKKKSKKDKNQGLENPALDTNDSNSIIGNADNSLVKNKCTEIEITSDIMLNVTSTPLRSVLKPETPGSIHRVTTNSKVIKRRKSVCFSEKNEEFIIPNKETVRDAENLNELLDINAKVMAKSDSGLENKAFDLAAVQMQENIDTMQKTIESYQAEVENDINEKKLTKREKYEFKKVQRTDARMQRSSVNTYSRQSAVEVTKKIFSNEIMVGDVGSDGENEKVEDGTKLRFKYAKFGPLPPWAKKNQEQGPKKSYKHLIKGDVILQFKNTNLHVIEGYAVPK